MPTPTLRRRFAQGLLALAAITTLGAASAWAQPQGHAGHERQPGGPSAQAGGHAQAPQGRAQPQAHQRGEGARQQPQQSAQPRHAQQARPDQPQQAARAPGQQRQRAAAVPQGGHFSDHQRQQARQWYSDQVSAGHCPPGLSKRQNGCNPPGNSRRWQMGKPLPSQVRYAAVPADVLVYLGTPPQGYRYVRVANDILLMAIGTRMVVDAITGLGSL